MPPITPPPRPHRNAPDERDGGPAAPGGRGGGPSPGGLPPPAPARVAPIPPPADRARGAAPLRVACRHRRRRPWFQFRPAAGCRRPAAAGCRAAERVASGAGLSAATGTEIAEAPAAWVWPAPGRLGAAPAVAGVRAGSFAPVASDDAGPGPAADLIGPPGLLALLRAMERLSWLDGWRGDCCRTAAPPFRLASSSGCFKNLQEGGQFRAA